MKRITYFLAAAAMISAACTKNDEIKSMTPESEASGAVPVSISLSGAYPVTKSSTGDNDILNDIQIVLYRLNGTAKTYESFYSFDPDEMTGTIYIDPSKEADSYLIAAYANQGLTENTHRNDWACFADEASDDMQMYGEWRNTKDKLLTDKKADIGLERYCSKVTVRNISLDWKNSANNYKAFTLKGYYLADTEGVLHNLHDVSGSFDRFNKDGAKGTSMTSFLCNPVSDVAITEANAYTVESSLYGYISDASRLVIEAEFDGEKCYYSIPVNQDTNTASVTSYNGQIRNVHFDFKKITITKPGAKTPYGALTEENDIQINLSVTPWSNVTYDNIEIK